MTALADALDALLPQTQCTRCGYDGCRPYAEAMANGDADINQCPPGGSATIAALAQRLQRAALPLNPANGTETEELIAVIDELRCIGCARCLPPCPVDAIIGAARQLHTVLYHACTGCELCVAPCPVDCIEMLPRTSLPISLQVAAPSSAHNRERYEAKRHRMAHAATERAATLAARKLPLR